MVTPHPTHDRSASRVVVVARRSVVLLLTLGLAIYILTTGRLERHQPHQRPRRRAGVGVPEIVGALQRSSPSFVGSFLSPLIPGANAEKEEIRMLTRRTSSTGGIVIEQIRSSHNDGVDRSGLNLPPHLRVETGSDRRNKDKRIISLVVPLFKAKADLALQLSYLAHAFERKRTMESVLPTVEFQLVVDASRSSCTDFLKLFPETAKRLVWFDDLDEVSFLATRFKQEAWLKKRYPHDDESSTDYTLSVDAASSSLSRAASWQQTAHHLQALLSQQSREPRFQQRFGAHISLPFLVSSDALESVQEVQALEFLRMHEAACNELPSVTVSPDETVVFFRLVEHTQDFPLEFPATRPVLILYDRESSIYLHSYRAMLEAAGHTVRMEGLQSQQQAFCLGRSVSHFLDTNNRCKLGEWVQTVAAHVSSASQNKALQEKQLRRHRRAPRSST